MKQLPYGISMTVMAPVINDDLTSEADIADSTSRCGYSKSLQIKGWVQNIPK